VIILIERKIRFGDIVAVGGMTGTVTAVDLRATTARGFDGIDATVFSDFGNDNLMFNLLYWTRLGGTRSEPGADSALRFAIAEALDSAGISIAFMQRDVHLDVPGALRVELAHPASPPAPTAR
jgi:small-conductance mechanosensitive channel